MPSPVRVGRGRAGRTTRVGSSPVETVEGAMSAYPNRADSIGYNPANPYAYSAAQAAKAYKSSRDAGDSGIKPTKFKGE